jgi:hypothetical protein
MAKRKEDRTRKPGGKENELNQKQQNDAQELRQQFGVALRAGVVTQSSPTNSKNISDSGGKRKTHGSGQEE